MNKYINLFLVGFICLWLNRNASTHDKLAVRNMLANQFNEPDKQNFIDVNQLPIYCQIANTNVSGWFLVISEEQIKNLGVDLNNVTVTKLNQWKNANMDNPNHLKWDRGETWEAVIATNGLRLVE